MGGTVWTGYSTYKSTNFNVDFSNELSFSNLSDTDCNRYSDLTFNLDYNIEFELDDFWNRDYSFDLDS